MKTYKPLSLADLNEIINKPSEVTTNPYKLFTAFAIDGLFDMCVLDEEEEQDSYKNYWGWCVPKGLLDNLIMDLADEFNDCAAKHKPLFINKKPYTIRKANQYDSKRLCHVFAFPLKDGEYQILPECIMDLSDENGSETSDFDHEREEAQRNRNYLRQVIYLAEDDDNDGWAALTDMEMIMYSWALFYSKYQSNNFRQFLSEYHSYINVDEDDIKCCLNDRSIKRGEPIGIYAFSAKKVEAWHKRNGFTSQAIKVSPQTAEDYWYDVAMKTNFRL